MQHKFVIFFYFIIQYGRGIVLRSDSGAWTSVYTIWSLYRHDSKLKKSAKMAVI